MSIKVGQFLQSLNDGGILSKEECARIAQAWPAERRGEDAKPLAIELVRQKLLTQFQALNLYRKAQFLVLGNYILLDILGEGGMGKVYKAVHRRMQRTVALKLLPAALAKETEILRRFQREAQAAAQLVHPNIVTAYDADEAQGVHFLVMEYVDGQDLGSYLKEQGVLPVAMAVECVMQAARGLDYAHAKGVVHRDIKPSNLLLSRDGVVKVMDLGLARFDPSQHVDASLRDAGARLGETRPREGAPASDPRRERTELTRQGQIIGTVSYMAPEQSIEMGLADARSDIYALGCTLYRLLTGDVLYSRDTTEATMAAHREAPIPSLRKFRRDVTPQLDAVLRKMLAKQPTDRYQSMAEVITALKALSCEAGPAQPVTQKAAGDDFKSDLLSSLMGLGPGAVGALLDNPADQNWNPADRARARTASHSRTAVNQHAAAPAHGRPPTEVRPLPQRSFPWGVLGLAGGVIVVGAMVFVYLRTQPPQNDPVAASNPAAEAKKPEPPTKTEGKVAEGATPTKTPDAMANKSPPKSTGKIPNRPRPADPDRAVAEWLAGNENRLLAMPPGGFTNSNQLTNIDKREDIPAGEFRLREMSLKRLPADSERFAELQYLEKLETVGLGAFANDDLVLGLQKVPLLRRVDIYGSEITDAAFAHLKAVPTLGELYFGNNAHVTAAAFEHIAEIPNLTALVVQQQEGLNDTALASVGKMTKLQWLILGSREITAAGLKQLAALHLVYELHLNDTRASDEGLAALGQLRSLQRIVSLKSRFNGTGFESFRSAERLRELNFYQSEINDEGLRHIGRLPGLEDLSINDAPLSDDGLRHLAESPKLKRLDLGNCKAIGDEGIKHLARLRSLERLSVGSTRVTREGADALKKMLPNCQIVL